MRHDRVLRVLLATSAALLMGAAGAAVAAPADAPEGSEAPAAPKKKGGAKADGRAAKKGAAPEKAPDEPLTDAQLNAKVRETARAAFVTVHITFRKDPEEMQGPASLYARLEAQGPEDLAREFAYRFVDEERTLDLPGLWLDADGTVLLADLSLPPKLIDRIEVRTGAGKVLPASLKAVLRDAPGWLLSVARPPGGGPFPAPAFADPGEIGPDAELTAAWIEEIDGLWSQALGAVGGTTQPLGGAPGPSYLVLGESGAGIEARPPFAWGGMTADGSVSALRPFYLLFDDDARPVGVALHDRLPVDPQQLPAWRGPAVQRGTAVPFDDLKALERKLLDAAGSQVAEIKLTFRQDAPEDEREGAGLWHGRARFRSPYHGAGTEDDRGREMTVYGIAVDDRRLLVPADLNEAIAARIEKIDVSLPGRGAPVPGRFVGAFKAFAGFLVETPEALAAPPADLFAAAALPRVRPIPTLRVIRKYGRRTTIFGTARILSSQRGYKHQLYPVADPPQAPGTFLFDLEGRPAGFVARLRREDEKVRALRDPDRAGLDPWDAGMHAEDNRLHLFRDVRAALADPAAFDPDIRVKTKFEERRIVWLGVETCLLNRELSRQMNLEGPTKGGQVGVMVVDVYDGSPARRLGLKDGDILLKVQEKGKKEPVEIRFAEPEFGGFRPRLDEAGGESENEEELWLSEPPWRPQRTPLNALLTTIGKGKTVLLTCLVDGREVQKELVLEEGPPDYESAERKKHEATGLTVRDLTYEVRRALRLPQDAPGVVVSRVEEGFPAAVARVHPYDVIQRVEGRDVNRAGDFVQALDAARLAGAASVKVQTLRLNRTRFVDLRFEVEADKAPEPGARPDERR
jgi:hypothetical protein